MRVAMYYKNNDVRLEEMPKPAISEKEILMKIIASGICGSDVMEWYRIKKAPLVLGHEVAGVVEEAGSSVKKFKAGDRVFATHHVPCNTCQYCLNGNHTACETLHTTNFYPGGFAEYVRMPEINVDRGMFLLPDDVSFEEGTFIEPLGCTIRGQLLTKIKPGSTVLVVGSGIAGILHIKLAQAFGAGKVIATDIDNHRLKMAKQFGASAVKATENVPEQVKEINEGRLADVVIICAGALSASQQALQSVDRGGRVLFFAVPKPEDELKVPINELWRKHVTMLTSYAANLNDLKMALDLIRSDRLNVKDMITHCLPLEETQRGFDLTANPKNSLKVIIEPHS